MPWSCVYIGDVAAKMEKKAAEWAKETKEFLQVFGLDGHLRYVVKTLREWGEVSATFYMDNDRIVDIRMNRGFRLKAIFKLFDTYIQIPIRYKPIQFGDRKYLNSDRVGKLIYHLAWFHHFLYPFILKLKGDGKINVFYSVNPIHIDFVFDVRNDGVLHYIRMRFIDDNLLINMLSEFSETRFHFYELSWRKFNLSADTGQFTQLLDTILESQQISMI